MYSILPENKKWIYYITGLQRRLFAVERTNASVLCICFVIFEKSLHLTYADVQLSYKHVAFAGYG